MGTDVVSPCPCSVFCSNHCWLGRAAGLRNSKKLNQYVLSAESDLYVGPIFLPECSSPKLPCLTTTTSLALEITVSMHGLLCWGAGRVRGLPICVYLSCWAFSSWLLISLCWLVRLWAHCLPSMLLHAQTRCFLSRLFSPEQWWRLSMSLSCGAPASIFTACTVLTSLSPGCI